MKTHEIALDILQRLKPIMSEDVYQKVSELIPQTEPKIIIKQNDNKQFSKLFRLEFGDPCYFQVTIKFFDMEKPGYVEFQVMSRWEKNHKEFTLFIDPEDISSYLSDLLMVTDQLVLHTAGIFMKDIPFAKVKNEQFM